MNVEEQSVAREDDRIVRLGHDLQQPINAIVILAELLLRGPLDAVQRDRAERLRAAAKHLAALVDDAAAT